MGVKTKNKLIIKGDQLDSIKEIGKRIFVRLVPLALK